MISDLERDIEKLSRKILTDAILLVEDNDYHGLLIEDAKTMIKMGPITQFADSNDAG